MEETEDPKDRQSEGTVGCGRSLLMMGTCLVPGHCPGKYKKDVFPRVKPGSKADGYVHVLLCGEGGCTKLLFHKDMGPPDSPSLFSPLSLLLSLFAPPPFISLTLCKP